MIRTPSAALPREAEVELIIRISLGGKLLGEGVVQLDNDSQGSIQFQSAGLAVQAGAYEVLRAIWPERVDSPPDSRTMARSKE